jgi:hypothetical protein
MSNETFKALLMMQPILAIEMTRSLPRIQNFWCRILRVVPQRASARGEFQ